MKKKYVRPSSAIYPVLLQSVMAENSEPADSQQTPATPLQGQQMLTSPSVTGTNSSICSSDVSDEWE